MGNTDVGVSFCFGCLLATKGFKVADRVFDLFDRERDNRQTHLSQVTKRHFLHALSEGVETLNQLFHTHCAKNRSQVTDKRFMGDVFDFFFAFAKKLLGSSGNRDFITFHFYLSNTFYENRHTIFRDHWSLCMHFNGHDFQTEYIFLLQHWEHHIATTDDDFKTASFLGGAPTGDDHSLVGTAFLIQIYRHPEEDKQ